MTRFLTAAAAACVFAAAAHAQVVLDVFPSVGPNDTSPSYPGYAVNAAAGVGAGGAATGTPGTPTFYQAVPSGQPVSVLDILATDFPSWRGTVNPAAPFNQELGNKLYFGVHVYDTTGGTVNLSSLAYSLADSYNGSLSVTGDYSAADYSPSLVGVIDDPAGPQFITSGSGSQPVNEIWAVGVGTAIPLPGSSFPGGPPTSGTLAGAVAGIPEFSITATYILTALSHDQIVQYAGSSEVTVSPAGDNGPPPAVPAPPGVGLALAGAAGLVMTRLRRARR